MSISELYEIGRKSRNPLAGLRKSRRGGGVVGVGGLVQELDDEKKEEAEEGRNGSIEEGDELDFKQVSDGGLARNATVSGSSNAGLTCMICRTNRSRYNCPSCNVPYCSLACYQSTRHASCSQPFLKKTLQSELGQRHADGFDGVEEGERKAMMDMLVRMDAMGQDGEVEDEGGMETGGGEENEDEDEGEVFQPSVDLGDASVEQLLSMLSAEEKARFNDAVEDSDPTHGRARSLLEGLVRQGEKLSEPSSSPWWKEDDAPTHQHDIFMASVQHLSTLQARTSKAASIEYNILALLLTYTYIVHHLEVHSLKELQQLSARPVDEETDEMPPLEAADEVGEYSSVAEGKGEELQVLQDVVRTMLQQLAPFLNAAGDASKVVLDGAESASLWFIARLDREAALEPAKTLSFLYADVQSLLCQPRLIDSSSSADKLLCVLADVQPFLSGPSQRKVIFYGAYWSRLTAEARKAMGEQVEGEMKRLQTELERAEDEERYRAANEALERQGVLVSDPV